MRLLYEYLKLHRKSLLLFSVFLCVFVVVFALNSIPVDAIIYSGVLCFFLALIIAMAGFYRFCKKHRKLQEMRNAIGYELENLPEPQSLIEQDYRELVEELFALKRKAESDNAVQIGEMTDYYTLWVHQIKTPIAAMHLLLHDDEEMSRELSEQLFSIEQYVEMALQYIRTESSATDYVIRYYELDEIVRQAIRKYAKSFIRKKIQLEYKKPECKVLTDEKWLTFVIEQLLSNALKYTRKGTISIYMYETKPTTLVIEDTGIGIQQEDLPRIFDKGYTGFNGRADKKSTGVGLYLCGQILKKLSHGIYIQSQVGKGTKVFLDLEAKETTYE